MNKYIGVKLIEAEPMNLGEYNLFRGWTIPKNENPEKEGYKVVYPDGYVSWSPKEIFETAYMKVSHNPKLKSNVSISQEMVDDFIVDYDVFTKKDKITIVVATLRNGFTIVESSACVDPANYSEVIGKEICIEKIKDKVWNHLGFLLQCGVGGIR